MAARRFAACELGNVRMASNAAALPLIPGSSEMSYPRIAPGPLALVVALHLAAIVALTHYRTEVPLPIEKPIIVSLVQPESAPPAPPVEPPKVIPPVPKPVKQKAPPKSQPKPEPRPEPVAEPTPQLVAKAPETAPAPHVAPPSPPVAEPTPVAEAKPEAPPAKEKPAPEAPPPVDPPRFNADYLDNPKPRYPPLSKKQGEVGTVLLRVVVSAAGLAQEVTLHKSSGFPRLDQSAIEAVRQWKFVPARQGNQAVEGRVIVPIEFDKKG
jgi:protein TonB